MGFYFVVTLPLLLCHCHFFFLFESKVCFLVASSMPAPLHHGYSGFSCDCSVFVREGEVMSIFYANFPDNIVLGT